MTPRATIRTRRIVIVHQGRRVPEKKGTMLLRTKITPIMNFGSYVAKLANLAARIGTGWT